MLNSHIGYQRSSGAWTNAGVVAGSSAESAASIARLLHVRFVTSLRHRVAGDSAIVALLGVLFRLYNVNTGYVVAGPKPAVN